MGMHLPFVPSSWLNEAKEELFQSSRHQGELGSVKTGLFQSQSQ